jgi:hypothetical protein
MRRRYIVHVTKGFFNLVVFSISFVHGYIFNVIAKLFLSNQNYFHFSEGRIRDLFSMKKYRILLSFKQAV